MGLVINRNPETNEQYATPKITPEGVRLGKAFKQVIENTDYYKHYRFTDNIPKDVLMELGNTININLDGFDECRKILTENLFEKKRTARLASCKDYVAYIYNDLNRSTDNASECRYLFFDYFSGRGEGHPVAGELKETAEKWEIIIGRQYFTAGLEIIWKYMLEELDVPMSKEEWFSCCLNLQHYSFGKTDLLKSIIEDHNYSFAEREEIIRDERRKSGANSIENGLKLILSIYNRFHERNEFSEDVSQYLYWNSNGNSISLHDLMEQVDEYMECPIKEFLIFIMDKFLLLQHLKTAFTKMLDQRDGLYVEPVGTKFVRKEQFYLDFQGIRMIQLFSVMKDLEVIQ